MPYLLMKQGGGFPYGVEAWHAEGKLVELHGCFSNVTDATIYAEKLRREYDDYGLIQVVKIEIPKAGRAI